MTEVNNTLRQADNKVVIKGKLKEKQLKLAMKDGERYINGYIVIRENENEHRVNIAYTKEKTNTGKVNGFFKGLVTVMNEYKSIAEVGEESADVVVVDKGTIEVNDFVTTEGVLVTSVGPTTRSINRATDKEIAQVAAATVEVYVDKVRMEVDREQMPTGRILIDSYTTAYGGKIIPLQLTAEGEQRVNYIQQNVERGQRTFKLLVGIVNKPRVVVTESKDLVLQATNSMMGGQLDSHVAQAAQAVEEKTAGRIKEYQVLDGEVYDELAPQNFATESIQRAKQEREAMLAEKERQGATPKSTGSQMPTGGMMGFGVQGGVQNGLGTMPNGLGTQQSALNGIF